MWSFLKELFKERDVVIPLCSKCSVYEGEPCYDMDGCPNGKYEELFESCNIDTMLKGIKVDKWI